MPLFEGLDKEAAQALAKMLVDELAVRYPPEIIDKALANLILGLSNIAKETVTGRKITVTIE